MLIALLLVCVIGLMALNFAYFAFVRKLHQSRRRLLDELQMVREQMPLAVMRGHTNMVDGYVESTDVEVFEFDLGEYKFRDGDVLLIARPDLNLM